MPLSPAQEQAIREYIVSNEGWRRDTYLDSLGIPTVGVGFNLDRPDAQQAIQSLGLNYMDVRGGTQSLLDSQVDALFSPDVQRAVNAVETRVPEFANLSAGRQAVLVDMAFNLGATGFGGFQGMIAAINVGDWEQAAVEMENSRWATQVGNRAIRNIGAMRGGDPPPAGGGGPKAKDTEKGGDKGKEGKEGASEKGKDSSDKGKDVSDKGKDASDKGKDVSDKGKDASDKGKDVSDKGKDSKDGKDMSDKGKDSKDGKDMSDKGKDSKDGKDMSDKGKDSKDGKDMSDKGKDSKDGKDMSDKGKDSKDGKDGLDLP